LVQLEIKFKKNPLKTNNNLKRGKMLTGFATNAIHSTGLTTMISLHANVSNAKQ